MNIKERPENEYFEFIEVLTNETVIKLQKSNDQIDQIKQAIWEYVDIGYSAGLSSEEVIDFFCVTSDSVVDRLKCDDNDRESMVYIFDRINTALFPKYFKDPAG